MMAETAKERIYREALEEIKFNGDVALDEQNLNRELTYQTSAGKQFDIARLALTKGDKLPESSVSTDGDDEEQRVSMPMEEFDKLQKLALSAHTDKLELEKVKKKLNTAKKALTEISEHYLTDESYDGDADYREIAIDALAAIGGGGCPVGAVGKNGLTKEELEGSGDD